MTSYISSFLDLLFPKTCAITSEKIPSNNELPLSYAAEAKLTPVITDGKTCLDMEKKFKGLFKYEFLLSSYIFVENGVCQKLVHLAKYKGQKSIFTFYGKQLAIEKKYCLKNQGIDIIVPVPNHWMKRLNKGYNQASILSKTIAGKLGISHCSNGLKKKLDLSSQTRKNKLQRLDRLSNLYRINKPDKINNKHVLLVDDVVTSGATIETCAKHLYDSGASMVSVYSFAVVQ